MKSYEDGLLNNPMGKNLKICLKHIEMFFKTPLAGLILEKNIIIWSILSKKTEHQ